MESTPPREGLSEARRIVVKIGTKSITAGSAGRFEDVARQVNALRALGKQVVLVSSGAIALGYPRLGLKARPTMMAELQASAAAGQSRLMHAYEQAFGVHHVEVAQVLLTHDGISDRGMYLNARAALDALLSHGVVPIINENDTISVDEIRFGDNDQLAAMVATLVGADVLVLLTDVAGLLDAAGQRIAVVRDVDEVRSLVRPHESGGLSLGGMESKLEAARRASLRGVPVVIADARDPDILPKLLHGADVGTLVLPCGSRMASRKHWIAYTLKPKGVIVVDEGAARAICENGKSLLPAGVIGVRGDFSPSDPVAVAGRDGHELARGLARYGVAEVARMAGAKTGEIAQSVGPHYTGDAVIHRDDLVVL